MKNYQRNVRPGSRSRETGSADIGKVPRMLAERQPETAGESFGGGRRRRRGQRPGEEKRRAENLVLVRAWSIAISCVALLVLAGIFALGLMRRQGESGVKAVPFQLREVAMDLPSPASLALSEDDALKLVRAALNERDVENLGELVRLEGTPASEAMEYFETVRSGGRRSYQWLGGMNANGLELEGVLLRVEKDGHRQSHLVLLVEEDGRWKLDFASFASLSVPVWEEFEEKRVDEIEVRVQAAPDNYYNGPFRDEREWTCYGFSLQDGSDFFLGYCKAGSAQAGAMSEIMTNAPRTPVRVTLRLKRVEGAEERQFEIVRVLAEGWVMGPAAYDERIAN